MALGARVVVTTPVVVAGTAVVVVPLGGFVVVPFGAVVVVEEFPVVAGKVVVGAEVVVGPPGAVVVVAGIVVVGTPVVVGGAVVDVSCPATKMLSSTANMSDATITSTIRRPDMATTTTETSVFDRSFLLVSSKATPLLMF